MFDGAFLGGQANQCWHLSNSFKLKHCRFEKLSSNIIINDINEQTNIILKFLSSIAMLWLCYQLFRVIVHFTSSW